MSITEFKTLFQPILDHAFEDKFSTYQTYTHDEEILEYISHSKQILLGGKHVRPYMAYVMYQAFGGDQSEQDLLQLLVALEVFHVFALIHDDIMDKGTMRHDVSTVHKFIAKDLEDKQRWSLDYEHAGISQAILVGDILFAWSLGRFQEYGRIFSEHDQAWKSFLQMIDEVSIGQMLDVDMMTRDRVNMELIEEKMRLKTAGYTFVHPLHIGASLAGRGEDMYGFCQEFGQALGLAFQTQDDIFDLVAQPENLQKGVLSDIKEHQHTFLTQHVFDYGSREDIRDLTAIWGSEVRSTDQEQVIDLFERTGALDYAHQMVETYLARARQICITNEELSYQGQEQLQALIDYIENRSY